MTSCLSEMDSDEKQLLVHQTSGTTVLNMMGDCERLLVVSGGQPASASNHYGGGSGNGSGNRRPFSSSSGFGSISSFESGAAAAATGHGGSSSSGSGSSYSVSSGGGGGGGGGGGNGGRVLPGVRVNGGTSSEADLKRIKFEELVERYRNEDTGWLEAAANNCMYVAGRDRCGRPIVVFIGKWFRSREFDTDSAVLYLIKMLHEEVVLGGRDYVVVYFHTRTSKDNVPSYSWIRDVYSTLGYDYKKRLKAFYIVHPTVWTKVTCWWFATFMAPAIKKKIHNIHALRDLTDHNSAGSCCNKPGRSAPLSSLSQPAAAEQGGCCEGGLVEDEANLSIPMFITEHDMSINGLRYYKP